MDLRYEIILYWSQADGTFVAEVPELQGCAADGPTYQEALAAVEVVLKEWIETAKELGRAIPQSRSIAVRIGRQLTSCIATRLGLTTAIPQKGIFVAR